MTEPYFGPAMTEPYFGPAMTEPYFGPAMTEPYFDPAMTEPYFGPAMTEPYFGRAMTEPYFGRAMTEPYFGCAMTEPYFGPAMTEPYFGPAMTEPYFGPAMTEPYFGPAMTEPYFDIAVGAPYGGIDGKGAVYIYHGSINGIITEPAQVIMASTISSDLYTFGYSIAGGLDMDNNFYPDVLVGAYDSSQAVLLRSRPVVNINAEINIHPPDVIDLEKKTCVKYDGTPVACFTLTVCFKFSGVHVPSSIAVEFTTSLDTYLKSHQKRAYFQKTDTTVESGAFTVHESSDWCRAGFILLRDDITDKYSPIAIDVNYRLVENQNVPSEELSPVLNNYIEPKVEKLNSKILTLGGILQQTRKSLVAECYSWLCFTTMVDVYIQNDCGDNRICVPDLLLMSQIDSVYIGSTETTTLSVVVTNAGDDAFEAYVAIQLPEGFDYVRVEKGQTDYTIACIDTPGVSGLVKCDVGNPLKKNAVVEFALTLSTLKLDDTLKTTEIQLYANCTNPEDPSTLYDNEKTEYISVKVKSVISFTGKSTDVSLQGDMPCIIDGKLNPENLQTNADFTISNYTESSKVKRGSRYRRDEKTVYRVDCQFAQCVKITCSIDFVLHGGDTALVEIKSRLWKDTVAKVPAKFDETEIKSDGHVLITSMPYSIPPESYPGADDEISSIAIPMSAKAGTLPVPIWVIIVSIIGGLLILALIIVVLWKAGFFKRKRVGVKYMEVSQNTTNENITMSDPPPGKNF
uniref:Integrin alpha-8-like n=1 Tax=Saccoglossus kowalevskii TaxID=10224 RepID=A0ABM0MYK9_SACKO|nr:PREDICTED: integrin alpha-8-like [Saccoglossus kowalevskii]